MDTASGLVSRVARQVARLGASLVIIALALVAGLVAGALIIGLLPPASEPVIVAPFRW